MKMKIQRVGEFEWFLKILLNNLFILIVGIGILALVGFVLLFFVFLIHTKPILGIIFFLLALIILLSYAEYIS